MDVNVILKVLSLSTTYSFTTVFLLDWRYDLMCGLTEMESYYLLNDVDLVHGMIENEFYEKLNEYLNAKFEVLHGKFGFIR